MNRLSRGGSNRSRPGLGRLLVLALGASVALTCVNGSPNESPGQSGAAAAPAKDESDQPLELRAKVLRSFPHDTSASTQGLLWFDGRLFESTGLWGRSSVRRVVVDDGAVERSIALASNLFGEGLARVGDDLIQLTWQSGIAIRYRLADFEEVARHTYRGQGWGLCFDGVALWRSDGSERLWRHDPESFAATGSIDVRLRGQPVTQLNELECAEGWIYANVWQRDEIVRIDAVTGSVVAVVDASDLLSAADRDKVGVLNGIAYRPETQSFFLTGKQWPEVFETVFVESSP